MSSTADIAERVTRDMIEQLEAGTVPWRQDWASGLPMRMSNGAPYRGSNIFVLGLTATARGYESPWWGTYDAIARLAGMVRVAFGKRSRWMAPPAGGCAPCQERGYACREHRAELGVRKGERGAWVTYWDRVRVRDAGAEDGFRIVPILRDFHVFNAEQARGLPARFSGRAPGTLGEAAGAEAVIAGYLGRAGAPSLAWDGHGQAFYRPDQDTIHLPARGSFGDLAGLYGTQFHEITHSTGHASRLARPGVTGLDHFGSGQYGREELVAEMGAAILCALTGTGQNFANSAAYIAGWLRVIRGDPRLVVQAAAAASRAVDLIRGISYQDGDRES